MVANVTTELRVSVVIVFHGQNRLEGLYWVKQYSFKILIVRRGSSDYPNRLSKFNETTTNLIKLFCTHLYPVSLVFSSILNTSEANVFCRFVILIQWFAVSTSDPFIKVTSGKIEFGRGQSCAIRPKNPTCFCIKNICFSLINRDYF